MAKFRYYITDIIDGCIKGTDDKEQAETYALSEDNFVVDTETGEWIQTDGHRDTIDEANHVESEEEPDPEEEEEEEEDNE